MKITYFLAALMLATTAALAGCTSDATSESTGEYIDDSVISNKVRAQLLDDAELNVFQIDVTTYKGVVQLSGFVDSAAAKSRASSVVAGIEGVRSIENDLIVK
ncbi:MAG: BON domain-containing protein [Tistlia sp.]|uniref:BON domain-containing protein n=1 Tax=Tistlia sp. TaxID=3057121 RepID=UPI0034A3D7C2